MGQLFKDALRTELDNDLTANGTVFTVLDGSAFPVANAAVNEGEIIEADNTSWFKLVLQDDVGQFEIVYCHTHQNMTHTFTVLRGQEGTTAREFPQGAVVGLRLLSSDINGILSGISTLSLTKQDASAPAAKADAFTAARTVALNGAVQASATWDGSNDLTLVTNNIDVSKANAGTLVVARGGTGATTHTSGQALIGNGTGAVTTRAIDTTSGGTSSSNSLVTSGAVHAGLATKANLASPALTGTPTAPTASSGTNNTQVATTGFVTTAVSAAVSTLLGSAPSAALDTLKELGDALGNDANFAATMTTALAGKLGTGQTAVAAYRLATARTINDVSFNGTANIDIQWKAVNIESGTDLNSLTSEGAYFCPANTGAATLLNCPTTNAFALRVWKAAGVVQELTEYLTNTNRKTYQRTFYNTWSEWCRVYTTIDEPSSVSGNAGTATRLATARNIALSGGVTGTATSFNGSANITIPVTAIDVDMATAGTLDVARGGTGTTTSTGTGSTVRSASPALTGTPTAPTAADGTSSTQLATTAFVQGAVGGFLSKSTTGGTTTLTSTEASNPVISFSGALTSNAVIEIPVATRRIFSINNGTTGSFTLTVKHVGKTPAVVVAQGKRQLVYTNGSGAYDAITDFESVALTGTPTAPTAATSVSNTQIATTAFVQAVNTADTGSSATAVTLKNARTINGTSFNGSANITTANWGTARNLTIGATAKSVNGSANVAWSLNEILPTGANGQVLKHNGTSWTVAAETNTTYSAMSQSEANTGTATTGRVMTAAVLKAAIATHSPSQTSVSGNAGTATKLASARSIAIAGAAIGSANFDGSANITINTTGLGVGQTWSKPGRNVRTTYTNSTGKPIMVAITLYASSSGGTYKLLVNDITSAEAIEVGGGSALTVSVIVPNGATYNLNTYNMSVSNWAELR